MSTPVEDFRDLGCQVCGGEVDEDWTCIDCGFNDLEDDYDPADFEDLEGCWGDVGDLVELGPAGQAALG